MKRRDFIAGLGSAAAWPVVTRAQQRTKPAARVRRIGWLDFYPETDLSARANEIAFRQRMEKLGWSVGRNLAINYRWDVFDAERARVAAASVLDLMPEAIICAGTPAVRALRQATDKVPIVFTTVTEPVAQGIVQSLAHPGGNITGFSYLEPSVGGKWVELIKRIAPSVRRIALLFNPDSSPYSRLFYESIEVAAPKFAVQAAMAPVYDPGDIEQVMTMLGRELGGGLIVSPDAFNLSNHKSIIEIAARHRLPTIYGIPGTAAEGGLIYYGVDIVDQYRQAAGYVDRIFRGERPADLPVQQPTRFSLTINAKTARTLGLTVPEALLVSADEVIQ
jgi:putative tryptophan/tyrosine transport system substrate-binding protein